MKNMRDARNLQEKGCAQDNAKIERARFAIQVFSRTIKFYPSSHEKILHLVHNYRFYRKTV